MARRLIAVALVLLWGGLARGYALDLGPVHIHGTDVKVGGEVNFDITVDKLTREEVKKDEKGEAKKEDEKNAKIRTLYGHRKDNDGDKFEIGVPYDDLDGDSKDLLKTIDKGKTYKMKVKRMDENWKLIKLREKN